ncbi:nuclear envelope integral membrane protein 1 isoform X2 [Canna indica]|uniref:Nuclear envelope integral membrane protein 1 isoform X2 n=1 Tax=Canna indica TaxID=4628 RepID=A0AAQ3KYE7_9LILI|nr:nuclear envelope integral membrane protein 1 isoform X2 [Canna indica]
MPPSSSLLLLILISTTPFLAAAATDADAELSVISNHPSKLVLPPGRLVDDSPGARPGTVPSCNRVQIYGFYRLRQPRKYANALKVKVSVSEGDAFFRIQTIEICFHKNFSLGLGMCPSGQWQKLSKASWVNSMSPYEQRILDIRMMPDPSRIIEVSTEEEFLVHRLVFLVLGVVMMAAAHSLSESVVFYYGGAMTLGIVVVMLIILFQGMKLLPTGRKSSLAIVLYSSLVGVGTFLLSYVSSLLRTMLVEIGISEDMQNPLGILLLVCLVIAGAWFGYWGVHKLVLTEEGSVDSGVAYFVEWATLILSAVLILQRYWVSLYFYWLSQRRTGYDSYDSYSGIPDSYVVVMYSIIFLAVH